MDALDISNNTTRFTVSQVREWKDMGIGVGIVQLLTGVRLAGDDCATQILTLLEGGLAVDCYVFPSNDGLPLTTAQRLALVPPEARTRIRQIWCDVEKGYYGFPSKGQVSEVHSTSDAWAPWQQCGDYSALWVASEVGWLPWPWPNRKQWLVYVLNSGAPNLGGSFSGTNNHVMTQYAMDVTIAGVSGMDLSRLTDAEASAVLDWLGGGGGADTVRIPQEYVDKFSLPDDSSQEALNGLIDNLEGVISEVRAEGADAVEKLAKIQQVLAG